MTNEDKEDFERLLEEIRARDAHKVFPHVVTEEEKIGVMTEEERQATEKWKADKTPEEIAELEARPLYFCSKDRPRGITKRGNMTRGEINSLVDDMYEMNDTEFILKYDIDPHEFEGKCPHPLLYQKRWIKSGNGYKENFFKPRKVKL